MTATLDTVAKKKEPADEPAELAAARELVRQAKEQGLSLTGPDGLLKQLTKTVLETALDEELTEYLGHERRAPAPGGNVRNGTRSKTVLTEASGHVEIDVPRDRAGTFEPQIVRKRQRRLSGVDEIVLSLYAKGLTTGEISAHFAEIYGASVSPETVSRIIDRVLEEMADCRCVPSMRSTRRSSSTRSWSRSVTVRSPTGRSTPPSVFPWTASATSWVCGPAKVARERNSG
jgi:putative transposase